MWQCSISSTKTVLIRALSLRVKSTLTLPSEMGPNPGEDGAFAGQQGTTLTSRIPPCVETCSSKVYEKRRELRELLYRKYGRTKQFSFKPKYFTKVKSIRRSGGIRKTNRMTTCKYLPRNPLGSFARNPLESTLNEKPLVITYRETHL